MGRLSIKAAVCTDIGINRKNNEDNYYLNGKYLTPLDDSLYCSAFMSPADYGVFGVFDGMGGQSRGEYASLCAAKTLDVYREKILNDGTRSVNEYIEDANKQICNEMKKTNQRIGSIAVVLTFDGSTAQVYNLGVGLSGTVFGVLAYFLISHFL